MRPGGVHSPLAITRFIPDYQIIVPMSIQFLILCRICYNSRMNEQFTVSTAATHTGLSVSLIRRYCRDGRLPATKVGEIWIIQKDDLDAFMEQERPSPGRPPKDQASANS